MSDLPPLPESFRPEGITDSEWAEECEAFIADLVSYYFEKSGRRLEDGSQVLADQLGQMFNRKATGQDYIKGEKEWLASPIRNEGLRIGNPDIVLEEVAYRVAHALGEMLPVDPFAE